MRKKNRFFFVSPDKIYYECIAPHMIILWGRPGERRCDELRQRERVSNQREHLPVSEQRILSAPPSSALNLEAAADLSDNCCRRSILFARRLLVSMGNDDVCYDVVSPR